MICVVLLPFFHSLVKSLECRRGAGRGNDEWLQPLEGFYIQMHSNSSSKLKYHNSIEKKTGLADSARCFVPDLCWTPTSISKMLAWSTIHPLTSHFYSISFSFTVLLCISDSNVLISCWFSWTWICLDLFDAVAVFGIRLQQKIFNSGQSLSYSMSVICHLLCYILF